MALLFLVSNVRPFITVMIDERTQVAMPGCYLRARNALLMPVEFPEVNGAADFFSAKNPVPSMRPKHLGNCRKKKRK